MAGNGIIQFLRGTREEIANSTEALLPGQPLYDATNNLLYIGKNGVVTDGTIVENLKPIGSGEPTIEDDTNRPVFFSDNTGKNIPNYHKSFNYNPGEERLNVTNLELPYSDGNLNVSAQSNFYGHSVRVTDDGGEYYAEYDRSRIIWRSYNDKVYTLKFPEQSGTFALTKDVDKNLYNLGAFDTYTSNNGTVTIARKTKYNDDNTTQNELEVEYQYIENTMENQPIHTLDLTGEKWLRDEWEKGLNLAENDKPGKDYYGGILLHLAEIGTYTLVGYNPDTDPTGYNLSYQGGGSDCKFGEAITFTTSEVGDISVDFHINDPSKRPYFMLVKGNHPYPYQPYNGKTIHRKDLENYLPQEIMSPLNTATIRYNGRVSNDVFYPEEVIIGVNARESTTSSYINSGSAIQTTTAGVNIVHEAYNTEGKVSATSGLLFEDNSIKINNTVTDDKNNNITNNITMDKSGITFTSKNVSSGTSGTSGFSMNFNPSGVVKIDEGDLQFNNVYRHCITLKNTNGLDIHGFTIDLPFNLPLASTEEVRQLINSLSGTRNFHQIYSIQAYSSPAQVTVEYFTASSNQIFCTNGTTNTITIVDFVKDDVKTYRRQNAI